MHKLYKLKKLVGNGYSYRLHNTKTHTFSYARSSITDVTYGQTPAFLKSNVVSLLKAGKLPKHYTLLGEWDHKPTEADLKQVLPELFI